MTFEFDLFDRELNTLYPFSKDSCLKRVKNDDLGTLHQFLLIKYVIPYGLAVRIPGFHPGGPGSTPGMGTFVVVVLLLLLLLLHVHYSGVCVCACACVYSFLFLRWLMRRRVCLAYVSCNPIWSSG